MVLSRDKTVTAELRLYMDGATSILVERGKVFISIIPPPIRVTVLDAQGKTHFHTKLMSNEVYSRLS